MVKREFYKTRKDGVDLYSTKSDSGFYIQKEGTDEVYVEAIDVADAPYTYVETDEKIATAPEPSTDDWEDEAQAAYIEGVNEA